MDCSLAQVDNSAVIAVKETNTFYKINAVSTKRFLGRFQILAAV